MCRLLGVKRNSYYSYVKRNKDRPDNPVYREMISMVKDIAKSSDHTYGERRMQKVLCALSFPVSRFKAKKLMDEAGVQVRHKKKFKVTTDSNHKKPVYPNRLKREFDVKQPNLAWVTDITYIRTHECWLYLAVVIDLFSRKVVGWSMSSRMKVSLV